MSKTMKTYGVVLFRQSATLLAGVAVAVLQAAPMQGWRCVQGRLVPAVSCPSDASEQQCTASSCAWFEFASPVLLCQYTGKLNDTCDPVAAAYNPPVQWAEYQFSCTYLATSGSHICFCRVPTQEDTPTGYGAAENHCIP